MFQTTALQISHSLTSSPVKWKADESGLASCSTPKLRVRPAWHFWREDRTYVAAIHKLTSGWDGVWEHRWKCKSAVWRWAHRKKKGKYFTSSFQANEKYSVPNSVPSTSRVCAVNFACQAHCFNLREKLMGIVYVFFVIQFSSLWAIQRKWKQNTGI